MPRLSNLVTMLILGSMLSACGGGSNDTLLNPQEPEKPVDDSDSGIVTSDPTDQITITNEFVGFFIESPEYNPDDYSVGMVYLKTPYLDADMKEGYPFEGISSYHFKPCQDKNLIRFLGFRDDDDSLDSYQTSAIIDGTTQTYSLASILYKDASYKGPYNFSGADNISKPGCVDYTLAVRGKVELYPLNTTQFTDTLKDSAISFDATDPKKIVWNYENFGGTSSKLEHLTVSILDKTRLDSLNMFQPIYQAQANLEIIEEREKDQIKAAQAAVDAAKEQVKTAETQVSAAETSVAAAQSKVDQLNALKAEVDRLKRIYDAMVAAEAATPGTYTAGEINAAETNWKNKEREYNLENIFRPDYESELAIANANLSNAKRSLSSAKSLLASREAALEQAEAAVKSAEAALEAAVRNYQPRMTEDVYVYQEVLPGNATGLILPDDISLKKDNYYLLNLVAWSSDGEKNYVYYHSSHVFRAD